MSSKITLLALALACVSLCPCVCQLVSTRKGKPFDIRMQNLVSEGFDGQGHRSKVKVTRLKNMIL